MESLLASLRTPVILFFVALSLRAIFSFFETTITALRLFKLKELAQTTGHYEALFQALEQSPHRVLITILIANSLTHVTCAALATHISEPVFPYLKFSSGFGFPIGTPFASVAILVFA